MKHKDKPFLLAILVYFHQLIKGYEWKWMDILGIHHEMVVVASLAIGILWYIYDSQTNIR